MNINIKTVEELNIMRDGGKILAELFAELERMVVEGSDSLELDKYAEFLCKRYKVKPAFKGYHGFPFTICSNLNEVIVHGYANTKKFKKGDIFGLDMGIIYNDFYLDKSTTIEIGQVSKSVHEFVEKTKRSMYQGIESAVNGSRVGDISEAMRAGLVGDSFVLMKDFVGHGIGHNLHEKPEIPGDGMKKGEGILLSKNIVLAIESISVMGPKSDYNISSDGWTVTTKDCKTLSALFEETIIVTSNGPEIITLI